MLCSDVLLFAFLVLLDFLDGLGTNGPLSCSSIVTLFLHHFNVPLDDEPYVKVKRSFSIGAGAVTSFGYRKDVDG